MAKANMKIQLSASAEQVWKVITDNKNYGWRSDLDRIEEMGDGKTFVEYTKSGVSHYIYNHKKRYRFAGMNLTWRMKT